MRRFINQEKTNQKQRRRKMIMALTALTSTTIVDAFLSGCVAGISLYTGKTALRKGRNKW